MAIAETQLETWSHQGSEPQSSGTYQTVQTALESSSALYKDKKYKVFLQGSYGNDTYIRAESDVDTVIRLDSIFGYDLTALPADQQNAFHQAFNTNATYTFDEFKRGVITRLTTAFGQENVTPGNKAIKIKANGSRRSADVVTCYQHRRYIRFYSNDDYEFEEGVVFPTTSSGTIINYPKQHSDNLTLKHQATNEWFKPTVRILKNMRSKLVDTGKIAKDTAPSYYIEGMLWNVSNECFGNSFADTFCNCINRLCKTDRGALKCAHEQHALLGTSNVQWSSSKCTMFLTAAIKLWQES